MEIRATPITLEGPLHWSPDAAEGLKDTLFTGTDRIADGVTLGQFELWKVNDDSWLVTEVVKREKFLLVWCYQGRGLFNVMMLLCNIAANNGLERVKFFSHKKLKNTISHAEPVITPQGDGMILYDIAAKVYPVKYG
jgi:hypothetical protein